MLGCPPTARWTSRGARLARGTISSRFLTQADRRFNTTSRNLVFSFFSKRTILTLACEIRLETSLPHTQHIIPQVLASQLPHAPSFYISTQPPYDLQTI